MQQNNKRRGERGNVFFLILLGVVLFLALALTVSRGMRSDNTQRLSDQRAQLLATDLITHGQVVARAVDRLRRKGCSENEISFENGGFPLNANAPGDNSCHIYHPDGGSVAYREIDGGALDASLSAAPFYSQWYSSGGTRVVNLGTANTEMTFSGLYVSEQVCETINEQLGITGIPVDAATGNQFTGSFTPSATPDIGDNSAVLEGRTNFCYQFSTSPIINAYTQVLIER